MPVPGALNPKDASARAANSPHSAHAEGETHAGRYSLRRTPLLLLAALALAAIAVTYSNHFHNDFHFDDSHTIVNNAYIRDLGNIPRFFGDARTFSSMPSNQGWRPLVSTSLALDYHLGHGLNPFWFHVSTFFWFVVLLVLLFFLYRSVLDAAAPGPANDYVALATVAWFGLHPANAETVNYIVQRADIYSTLGVVAGLVVYRSFPDLRRYGVYLVPVVLGALSKQTTLVFCVILLIYVFLFEEDADRKRLRPAVLKTMPAFVVCGVLAVATALLTPRTSVPSILSPSAYRATQPYVILRYVRSLFLPLWLSADTDLRPFTTIWQPLALAGVAFCVALLVAAVWAAKRREYRPIAFGILWFFCALAPTSLIVLSEVENDHRMFFAFAGLMLSVTWALTLVVLRMSAGRPSLRARIGTGTLAVAACLLAAYAIGTWQRNEVWRTEGSLWHDVTLKSPRNGRGLMNYGLTLMEKGDAGGALDYFQKATALTPGYWTLEINTAIALGLLNRAAESESHFRRALELQPDDPAPYYFYGRWLDTQGRTPAAQRMLRTAIDKSPAYLDARHLLMQTYLESRQWDALRELADATLRLAPDDAPAAEYLRKAQTRPSEAGTAAAGTTPTAEDYLNQSLASYRSGRYEDAIEAARKALRLRPDYAEAYNNISAAYASMRQWDPAIDAAQQALRLKPDFALAKNNLAWAQNQKKLSNQRR